MEILISKKFISNLLTLRKRDWKEDLNNNDIFDKIKKTLIFDEKIKFFEKVTFKIINNSFQGVYLPKKKEIICFTQMLNFLGKTRSRNTFISQNSYTAYKFSNQKNVKLSISINPFDLEEHRSYVNINSIKKDLMNLHFLSIKINKSIIFDASKLINCYSSIETYVHFRNEIKNKNSKNNSTYTKIFNSEKEIVVYGRLDGANFSDFIFTLLIIKKLNFKKYKLFFSEIFGYKKNKTINSKYKEIQELGYEILDFSSTTNSLNKIDINYIDELKRNQKLFTKQIIENYSKFLNVNKCFACDYNISTNLIASHIHRYSDIKNDYKNKKIDFIGAQKLISSGNNGFFLCPNHDKEFEKGFIFFNYNKKIFEANPKMLNEELFLNVKNKIQSQNFQKISFNLEFKKNLENHIKRISI
ncbi:HNH endonuclease signature motif containing protein [Mesomycoplasma neurolyticum]|uniref:HNH nuclease domain-containing protein n=1 Tax=Mesomycoplasma neurolyticum TaxID=2120 RepID=A0A449A677_9BACT|nr:HNH endonuclease signature motif containing protein [Mesomycoplasma neurolyticum]VEU59761.1 Uncharacterised protein [Mesomycoplasma neurolyticum]